MVELLWGIHRPSDCNGFDIVIGNPPYLSSKAIIEKDKKSYSRVFKTTTKQYDLFSLFIELSITLANRNGVLSYIVPDSLIGRSNFEDTRRMIISDSKIHKWLHINNVFDSANVASLIYVCKKANGEMYSFLYQKTSDVISWQKGSYSTVQVSSQQVLENDSCKVIFADESKIQVLSYLRRFPTFDSKCVIWRGEEVGKKDEAILRKPFARCVPILTGEDVHRYELPTPTKWIAKNDILKDVPYGSQKLLIRQLGDSINATIDFNGVASTQSVYSVLPEDSSQESLYFYLGILNSKLFDFIYNLVSGDKQTFKRIILENVKALPLPVNYTIEMRNNLALLVKQRIEAKNGQMSEVENEINDLVFRLYGIPQKMQVIIMA